METTNYQEPVAKLLTYGEPNVADYSEWPNYLEETGIRPEHISDLLRMIDDKGLHTTDPDEDDPKYWGPVHAWRTLGQLQAASAVKPLLDHAPDLLDYDTGWGEWALEELPDVYGLIGKDAIPLLTQYLADTSYDEDARINISTALEKIAEIHPETREECIKTLVHQLEAYEENTPEINAFLISRLSSLKAKEGLSLIESAFASDNVDESIIDLDYVLIKFGLKEAPPTLTLNLSNLFTPEGLRNLSAQTTPPKAVQDWSTQTPPPLSRSEFTIRPVATPSEKYFTGYASSTKSKENTTKKAKQKTTKASRKKNRRK
jgi:hypothetical protein